MAVDFFGLDLTNVVPPKAKDEMPTKIGSHIWTTLGTILNWIITGKLKGYVRNRGKGVISIKTSSSVRESIRPGCIGILPIAKFEGTMTMDNWQSRAYGSLQRHIDGNMTNKDYDMPVAVIVGEDFVEDYRTNNAQDPHTTQAKIMNKDLTYGAIWEQMKPHLSDGCHNLIGDNRWTVLSSFMWFLRFIGNNGISDTETWNWPNVYARRMVSMKIANNVAGFISLPLRHRESMIDGIRYWYDLMMALRASAGAVSVQKITSSAGFFGFIVTCKMTPGLAMPQKIDTIVKRILKNLDKVNGICPQLCRGNKVDVIKFCGMLTKMLGIKQRHLRSVA